MIADPEDANAFYAVSLLDRMFYRSTDGGANFTAQAFVAAGTADRAGRYSVGRRAVGRIGSMRRRDGAEMFGWRRLMGCITASRQSNDADRICTNFGCGRDSCVRVWQGGAGEIVSCALSCGHDQRAGRNLSFDDEAKTWTRINDDQHQWGLILQIAGDPRMYGRVYVGTHGRGIFYGDPVAMKR